MAQDHMIVPHDARDARDVPIQLVVSHGGRVIAVPPGTVSCMRVSSRKRVPSSASKTKLVSTCSVAAMLYRLDAVMLGWAPPMPCQ